jgi:hypothetical protein
MPNKAKIIFRKWNRIIHRDFGYFFFGITLIYSISGIAVNHKADWNPNYNITQKQFTVDKMLPKDSINDAFVLSILKKIGQQDNYKKYYFPTNNEIRIFLKNSSSVTLDIEKGTGYLETLKKRPFLYEFNYLHYNPGRWWVWFSDIYAGALILIAISGLFIITNGRHRLRKRGIWFVFAGLIFPILAIFFL